MKIHILGSAAGGGFPQWNCNCANCRAVRAGQPGFVARTQSSIAISAGAAADADWLLCNASPDLLAQIRAFPALQPARALRDTAIRAVMLMDAQIDHVTGLMMLREHRAPLPIWCHRLVRDDLSTGHPVFEVLSHYCGVDWHEVPLGEPGFRIAGIAGLHFTAVPLTSNAPPYSPRRDRPAPGDNVGLLVHDPASDRRLFYAPGLGSIDPPVWSAMRMADCVLVDGTMWTDDEMIALGASTRRARDMGHLPLSGPGGMLEWLDRLPASTRKILIHINNTNPILDPRSPARATLATRGIEIAYDGMEWTL